MSKTKKKIILIGRSTAGKTTLIQRITDRKLEYSKTQALNVIDNYIFDTPGEYLERVTLRGALTVTSADADVIVLVKDAKEETSLFPPSYSSLFLRKPVIGVVTKIEDASVKELDESKDALILAGAQEVYLVSAYTGEGIDAFIEGIQKTRKAEVE
ncbi:MAG: EutP/PduV family microcompartment system protein [Synergistaceae bacterium]